MKEGKGLDALGQKELLHYYSKKEEALNILSHFFGFILSIIGGYFLILKTQNFHSSLYKLSFIIYGISLTSLYAASTLYHSTQNPKRRRFLNIVDHAAIYILIAGSYTPFTIITLNGNTGDILSLTVWIFAIIGVLLKLVFTGRYEKLSTFMYVFMGWLALFAIKPLIESLHPTGLLFLLLGGINYTIGAVFYSFKSIKYNHVIFHVFVLIGSLFHYLAIYLYVE